MTLVFRFRGEFRQLVDKDSAVVHIPGEGPVSLDFAISRLMAEVLDSATNRIRAGNGDTLIRSAAFFCDGRLLKPQDLVVDRSIINILSPLAGG